MNFKSIITRYLKNVFRLCVRTFLGLAILYVLLKYLDFLLGEFEGDWVLALAAFWISLIPFIGGVMTYRQIRKNISRPA